MVRYPASRVSFDLPSLPDLSRKIEEDSARRVMVRCQVPIIGGEIGQSASGM